LPDVRLMLGDCLVRLRELPDNSVDACVTDPPYGLSFMGKAWDKGVPSADVWREVLRVLKPGGHLLAFAGTRTQHRMACAIEDAGFEIRDMIAWVYGSGFPKSLDVSKAIDKAAGAEREVVGQRVYGDGHVQNSTKLAPPIGTFQRTQDERTETAPATPEARQWQGWGTALKPALEPITMARKPLTGTVAGNMLEWDTGALNIDGCRVGTDGGYSLIDVSQADKDKAQTVNAYGRLLNAKDRSDPAPGKGRWPANLIHDGSDDATGFFHDGAERFFYCPKADQADRDDGLEGFRVASGGERSERLECSAGQTAYAGTRTPARNIHPTVKPTDLMRYLCKLVTPPGGMVLDPFMGSGSTGRGAVLGGFGFIGIELDPEYIAIARARIEAANVLPVEAEGVERESAGQLKLFG
jgi:DNA modification methylase